MASSVPFIDLHAQRRRIEADLRQRLDAVLAHGQFILGPEVGRLERRLAEFAGAPDAVTCANGTDALVLALRALGVQPGDVVIVPAFTFCATAEAVVLCGAVPFFADVDSRTFNLTPETLGAALAACREASLRPVGVIVVGLFGQPADHPALDAFLADLPESERPWVLEDAAQSFGGAFDGVRAGALAPVSTVSFFPAKPLGCYGDGGAVFTADAERAECLRSLRFHGKGAHQYENVRIGCNSRLDTLQAAVLLAKLEVFEEELEVRQQIAARYTEALADVADTPVVADSAHSCWAQYTLQLPATRRDAVAAGLRVQGIPSGIYYPRPLNRQGAYFDYPVAPDLSVSEDLCERVLSLPMHAYLEPTLQDRIIETVRGSL